MYLSLKCGGVITSAILQRTQKRSAATDRPFRSAYLIPEARQSTWLHTIGLIVPGATVSNYPEISLPNGR